MYRLCIVMIVYICVMNDTTEIRTQELLVYRGKMSCFGYFWNMFTVMLRYFTNTFLYVVVTCYLLTSDPEEPESYIEMTKHFTALIILIEIDNIMLGPAFKNFGKQDIVQEIIRDEEREM